MRLQEFLELPDGGEISHRQAQVLNREIASTSLEVLSRQELDKVKDYLTTALNMESVEMDLAHDLEKKLLRLQELQNQ